MNQFSWLRNKILGSAVVITTLLSACGGAQDGATFSDDDDQSATSGSGASNGQGGATSTSGTGQFPTSGATTGQGGATTGTTASVAATSGASTSTSSGSGDMCSESPCKVTSPQCGCPNGQKCTLDKQNMRVCEPDGQVKAGESCSGPTCEAGSMCLGSPLFANCKTFCDTDSDCAAPGGLCMVQMSDGQGGPLKETWCTDNCSPVTGNGCPASGKCVLFREPAPPNRIFTDCWAAGTSTQDQSCVYDDDCAAGYACIGHNGGICARWCDLSNPSCPGVTTCHAFSTPAQVGGVEYGACI